MERAYIGVTDHDWAGFLRDHPEITEVNFWQPKPHSFKVLSRGEPFLFKTNKRHGNLLVGGGFFADYLRLRVSEARRFFGQGNGVSSEAELREAVVNYRNDAQEARSGDPEIGCIILDGVFFVDPSTSIRQPPDWSQNIMTGKSYDLQAGSYVDTALRELLTLSMGIRIPDELGSPTSIPGPVFLENRQLHLARCGQQRFKAAVTVAYSRRCAITRNHISPVLQAAHILPASKAGENRVDNGLLLRSDVHTLFDLGYLGIDDRQRLQVSPLLREDFGNGQEFYSREGDTILLPQKRADWPNKEFTEWHMDTIFKHNR